MAENNMDLLAWLRKQLAEAEPDLLREMVKHASPRALMGAEADALCGAAFRERSDERVNRRNGYRERPFDTRAGTIDLAVPKLRSGSYFPDWLLERRRRAERALVAVVAECYVRGVSHAPRRRPGEDARHRGHLEEPGLGDGEEPRRGGRRLPLPAPGRRPLPLPVARRPGGAACARRAASCSCACVVATAVNADGHREILGLDTFTSEDEAAWRVFLARPRGPRPLRRAARRLRRPQGPHERDRRAPARRRAGSAAARTSCATC